MTEQKFLDLEARCERVEAANARMVAKLAAVRELATKCHKSDTLKAFGLILDEVLDKDY